MSKDESKFRVWDDGLKCYRTDNQYAITGDGKLLVLSNNKYLSGFVEESKPSLIVERITPFEDKKGVSIYVHDVVHRKNNKITEWVVLWLDIRGSFVLSPVDKSIISYSMGEYIYFDMKHAFECEIVNNINFIKLANIKAYEDGNRQN